MFALLFIYCLGVNIAKIYKVDTVSAGLVSLASFVISIGSTVTKSFPLANVGDVKLDQILQGIDNLAFDGKNLMVTIGNVIPGNHINARGRKGGISSSCWGSVVVTSSERLLETSLR
ncbi:PTS system, IIC component [Streptococcus pneumoniae G54]|nr:PTS system, IIC component [Streptococcus pneumoniae G54]